MFVWVLFHCESQSVVSKEVGKVRLLWYFWFEGRLLACSPALNAFSDTVSVRFLLSVAVYFRFVLTHRRQ